MKKIILMTVLTVFSLFSLNAKNDNEKYYAYGVDFTQAKVVAAKESISEFSKAFHGINMLLVQEPDKYDFSKMVKSKVTVVIEPMLLKNDQCTFDDLKTLQEPTEEIDNEKIIKDLKIDEKEGKGILLIAKSLNKATDLGTYNVVLFDIATRQILEVKQAQGKTRGFGLRNYWAFTVFKVLQKTKLDR